MLGLPFLFDFPEPLPGTEFRAEVLLEELGLRGLLVLLEALRAGRLAVLVVLSLLVLLRMDLGAGDEEVPEALLDDLPLVLLLLLLSFILVAVPPLADIKALMCEDRLSLWRDG